MSLKTGRSKDVVEFWEKWPVIFEYCTFLSLAGFLLVGNALIVILPWRDFLCWTDNFIMGVDEWLAERRVSLFDSVMGRAAPVDSAMDGVPWHRSRLRFLLRVVVGLILVVVILFACGLLVCNLEAKVCDGGSFSWVTFL